MGIMAGKLILARHHESEWNKLGKWTGVTNVGLSPYGFEMSRKMGELIKGVHIDQAFASEQKRSFQTLKCMEEDAGIDVPIIRSAALNERDYGDYTGKDKWQVKKEVGEEAFEAIRRGWDVPVPHGETLKMVYERAVPYYLATIVPLVAAGKDILVVAHGNSLRSLVKYIENVSDEAIVKLEFPFGGVFIYDIDADGHMVHKEIRQVESKVNA